jgi:hypothetical protein
MLRFRAPLPAVREHLMQGTNIKLAGAELDLYALEGT